MSIPESSLHRKLRGPMAAWDVTALLLRQIDLRLAQANWQRSGGKGQKPKPIVLPDGRGRGDRPVSRKVPGEELARRLRGMGLIPPGTE